MAPEHHGIELLPVITLLAAAAEIARIIASIRERDEQRLQLELIGGSYAGRALFSGKAQHPNESASRDAPLS